MAPQPKAEHVEQDHHGNPITLAGSDTLVIDDQTMRLLAERMPDLDRALEGAQRATDFEHDMTPAQAWKMYPKAIMFSMSISVAIIMEGYDLTLIASFFAYKSFQDKFGVLVESGPSAGEHQVTPNWQAGLQNGAQVGEILGLMLAGYLADRFGYKKTLLGCLFMIICTIFLQFFAQNVQMLLAGEILCGLPWGAFQTLTTTYAAEVSPIALRPYLTTWVNLCWGFGSIIATGVLRGLLGRTDQWSWRIPYAIQWVWPIPVIIGVIIAPESPWWLVRKGRVDEARRALAKLASKHSEAANHIDDTLDLIKVTNEHENLVNSGGNYQDCFKGTNLRRTEIVCGVWIAQVLCGIAFSTNIAYFMEQAGLPDTTAFDFGLGLVGLGITGTLCFWLIMPYIGRRTLYVWGMAGMLTILLIVGFLGIPAKNTSIAYASGALLLINVFIYDITVGPACYCLVAELPSTRLRVKSVVLARNCYNIIGIAGNFLQAPILNPLGWNLRGKGAFIWASLCFLTLIWVYFRLPEPKGRSPAELDLMFENHVPAREFSKTKVDPFNSSVEVRVGVEQEKFKEDKL
jgi:SP family general alpha glucoside:H+ symporter-like MFS transporter